VGAERADFVLPGCAIFEAIRRMWPVQRVTVADRGLREGMLLRMMRERPARFGAAHLSRPRQVLPLPT
jgi:exopolyphosphatase/guanosine-5'-triphosphate,3'-diphosphate pyrophosphatase